MFHPMSARLQGPALAKLSATCKTWRMPPRLPSGGPCAWPGGRCSRFSVQSCDWKQRYAMLSQCGAPPATPTFNIDEYEFFLSARAVGTVPLSAPRLSTGTTPTVEATDSGAWPPLKLNSSPSTEPMLQQPPGSTPRAPRRLLAP